MSMFTMLILLLSVNINLFLKFEQKFIYFCRRHLSFLVPNKCSELFQCLIESLLITHAECKLNNIGHLVYETIYENSDPNRALHKTWCANLTHRRLS